MLSDPVTLAMMHADGVDPQALAAAFPRTPGKLARPSLASIKQEGFVCSTVTKASVDDRGSDIAVAPPQGGTASWDARFWRNRLRLVSGLVLLAFVVSHLTGHCFLLVS